MVGLRYVSSSLLWTATLLAADSNEAIFREKILPSLQANCASCHGGATPASSLSLADFNGALAGGKHGPALTPWVLQRVAELTDGRSIRANTALIINDARVAGLLAGAI